MTYEYGNDEKEYIFCVKGRPFPCLVSPHLPTPTSSLLDYNLVRDLGLKMTDLQCHKFSFAGYKMRILGKIAVTVQCIHDGVSSGCFHIKANVVLDLAKNLDTECVAGNKMAALLRGEKFPPSPAATPRTPSTSAAPSPAPSVPAAESPRTPPPRARAPQAPRSPPRSPPGFPARPQYAAGQGVSKFPNNCGFNKQWLLPEKFYPCGEYCSGGFCSCLRRYNNKTNNISREGKKKK